MFEHHACQCEAMRRTDLCGFVRQTDGRCHVIEGRGDLPNETLILACIDALGEGVSSLERVSERGV